MGQGKLSRDQRSARLAKLISDIETGDVSIPGSKASVRNQAIYLLAQELGITTAALHQQDRRERTRIEKWSSDELGDPIALRGMSVDTDFLIMVRQLLAQLDSAKAKLHGALVHLQRINGGALPFTAHVLRPLMERTATLIRDLEETRPASLCPYCRAVPDVIELCDECGATGLVPDSVLQQAPARLLNDTEPYVVVNGRYKALTQDKPPEEVESEDVADIWD